MNEREAKEEIKHCRDCINALRFPDIVANHAERIAEYTRRIEEVEKCLKNK